MYDKEHQLTSVAVVDWDNDGDQDLLLGAKTGAIYTCMNEGSKKEPQFATEIRRLRSNGKPLSMDSLTTPRIADWNQDGMFDVLYGCSRSVYALINKGKVGKPEFGEPQLLVEGSIPITGQPPVGPEANLHIEIFDYDHDGDLDLLVGGQSEVPAKQIKLTRKEQIELKSLKDEMNVLEEKMNKFYEGMEDEEDFQKLEKNKEFVKLSDKMMAIYPKIEKYEPIPESLDTVWVYRNKSTSNKTGKTKSKTNSKTDQADAESVKPSTSSVKPKALLVKDTEVINVFDVNIKPSFQAVSASPGERVKLIVDVTIPDGFHLYGAADSNFPTAVSISNPGSLKPLGEFQIPNGKRVSKQGKVSFWLEGQQSFETEFEVPADFKGTSVEGRFKFMICDDRGCRPPKTVPFRVSLSAK